MKPRFACFTIPLSIVFLSFVVYMSMRYTGRKYDVKGTFSNGKRFPDMDYSFISNEHNFQYLISEPETCQQEGSIFLLVVVCVSPANTLQRQTIRETWGSIVREENSFVKLVFLLGNPHNASLQTEILIESAQHQDIVQEDFIDSYRNLSIKSVSLLKWVAQFCKEAKYILKVDDDMFIHIPNLISILRTLVPYKAVLGCQNIGASPIRDPSSKWYTSEKEYSKRFYPHYVSGTAYVLTQDSIKPLLNASQSVALFWLEDIFITGICRRLAKVQIIHRNEFTYLKRDPSACSFKKAVSGHRYSMSEIRKIWKEIQDNVPCPSKAG